MAAMAAAAQLLRGLAEEADVPVMLSASSVDESATTGAGRGGTFFFDGGSNGPILIPTSWQHYLPDLETRGTTLFTRHFLLYRIVPPVHHWPYRYESRWYPGTGSHVPFRYDRGAREKRIL